MISNLIGKVMSWSETGGVGKPRFPGVAKGCSVQACLMSLGPDTFRRRLEPDTWRLGVLNHLAALAASEKHAHIWRPARLTPPLRTRRIGRRRLAQPHLVERRPVES